MDALPRPVRPVARCGSVDAARPTTGHGRPTTGHGRPTGGGRSAQPAAVGAPKNPQCGSVRSVTTTASDARAARAWTRLWLPRQHGAWAMLAIPILVGVAASRPAPWHLVLAAAALAGYLVSATAQAWLRARRRPSFLPSLAVYGAIFAAAGFALLATFPALVVATAVVVPVGALVLGGARPGTPRDLANSLGQTVIALVLVPAAVLVSGAWDAGVAARATLVAAGYLFGTVLVVRSVIRERGNRRFVALAVGFHVAVVGAAALVLPWPYALGFAALAARAAALPLVERRRTGTVRPLRPVHVGVVEAVASALLVLLAFLVPV